MRYKRFLFALPCLFAAPAWAQAREQVLLPAVLVDETERGESEVYDPMPAIRGTYAHGVAEGQVLDELDQSTAFCQGSDDERRALIETYGARPQTEFWFYGTTDQGVVFIRTTRLSFNPARETPPCSRAVRTSLEIERAYVADGFIHNFVFADYTVPELGSHRKSRAAGQYSGSFMRVQTLMARPPLPTRRSRGRGPLRRETVAGVAAVCDGQSGLVWYDTCYAAEGDLRGMTLRSASGDDERVLFEYRVLEVRSGALLPGAVFEVDREWDLRDEN